MYISSITQKAKEKLLQVFDEENIENPVVSVFVSDLKIDNQKEVITKKDVISFGIYKSNAFPDHDIFEVEGIKFLDNDDINNLFPEPGVLDIDGKGDFTLRIN